MTPMISPIANQRPSKRPRFRRMKPWGFLVHTSGRGIIDRAERKRVSPISLALAWYRSKGSVHYVIDHDGTIFQMLDDDRRGAHVGISLRERLSYLSGRWIINKKIPFKARLLWKNRWPDFKSPQHLYPTKSPNACYIGVELLPLANEDVEPGGLWFTPAQHAAVRDLALDLAGRHGWPEGWMGTPRLVGHEDVDAFARWDGRGGWDPGAMRIRPRFSWDLVLNG